MTPETVDLIKYVVAVVVPAVVGLLTLWLTNRHNRSHAASERAHQKALADAATLEARTAQMYGERRVAFMSLIDRATQLRDESLKSDYEGERRPSDYLDGPELEDYLRPLRQALNEVLLLGTKETRDAAERVRKATVAYVWSWGSDDYRTLDQALIDLRAAARADLGIEGGAPDLATGKPAKPEPSGGR